MWQSLSVLLTCCIHLLLQVLVFTKTPCVISFFDLFCGQTVCILWPSLKKATSAAVILDLSGSFNVSYSNMDIANVLYIHGPVLELD